ncbi:MAG: hypothetical protein H6819_11715 [Phycisphaerales bacterium]|nr:hypothetical protein [Phycisphaerales bacterium]MCB9854068.1 hypothetical protein [Phycisphaerales bacterium]MCB9864378.1 hypothetical protein [Phycisphaerales bacterium]
MNYRRTITMMLMAMAALPFATGSNCEQTTNGVGNMVPNMIGDNANDNQNDNTDGTLDVPNNDVADPNDDTPPSNTWSKLSQPCGGTKTNAMWFDDRENGFIGCGENASGTGLFVTKDGGLTWEETLLFKNIRINDVTRAKDGNLYATGTDTSGGPEAFMIDESGANLTPVGIYSAGNNAFTSVGQGENIAVTDDGQIFIDSLTGTQTAYRDTGDTNFTELNFFITGGTSEQVSRVIAFNNRFWAVGSLINQPGTVYYPTPSATDRYEMTKLELQPSNQDGELHDIYLWSETSGLVCGFDQSQRFPLIYSLDGDPSDINNWTKINLFDSGINYQGGAWKMSVVGDVVVIVGQTFPNNHGFVVFSADRGKTWTDISPMQDGDFAANLMTNVWLFPDGTILAAAESGEMWRFNP